MKLVGKKTNRAAIGARIKVVTAGEQPADDPPARFVGQQLGEPTRSSSTSAWPRPSRVADLEIHWPTSGTTQVFHDIAADQSIEIVEFATEYRRLPLRTDHARTAQPPDQLTPAVNAVNPHRDRPERRT